MVRKSVSRSQAFASVLRLCLPQTVRRRAWANIRDVERRRREAETQTIPYHDLEHKHVEHAQLLASRSELLARMPQRRIVAEIGVDEGEFSAEILAVARPVALHLIDIWNSARYHEGKHMSVAKRFHEEIAAGHVVIHRGYSTEVLPNFPDSTFDWVYIDRDHGYAVTAAELALARAKVKPGRLHRRT